MKQIAKTTLPILFIEALLIFGSVYSAFLLEDRRSRNFERKVLIGKLESLERILTTDSTVFELRLGTSDTPQNNRYVKSIEQHHEALKLLKYNDEESYLKVYEMHKNYQTYHWIFQIAIKSKHNIESIKEGFEYLRINDSTMYWLEKYEYRTWAINKFTKVVDDYFKDIDSFGSRNYFVLSDNEKNEDIIKFVSHPYYYNCLKNHLKWMNYLKDFEKRKYDEEFLHVKSAIRKEITFQYEML